MDAAAGTTTPGQAEEASVRDDRIWAALAHASACLTFAGPLVPLIMWVIHRRKSPYVAFQALQAMLYQSLFFWAWFTLVPFVLIILLVAWSVLSAPLLLQSDNPAALIAVPEMVFTAALLGSFLVYDLGGVAAAVACLMGRDFRYPLMGARMARYVGYAGPAQSELGEDPQDRIVAAASHSTAMVPFFGILTPVTAWITQRERSRFLGVQAIQAAIYQAIGLVGYFALLATTIIGAVGAVGLALATENFASSAAPAWLAAILLPVLGVLWCFNLAIPLYHLFAFVGTVRVLREHDFRYPVLGRVLARREP